mgnify:CR=1 FL=1
MDKNSVSKETDEFVKEIDKIIEEKQKEIDNKIVEGINMENKKIMCKDCGKEFMFIVGEQEFYKEKGFNDPVRCKECRVAKKERFKN